MFAYFSQFQVGFSIEIFCFNEGCFLLGIEIKEHSVTGKIMVLFDSDYIANSDVSPLPSGKANGGQNLDLTLIL